MNNVVFAAAGNGKTYNICKQAIEISAQTCKNILIVTYTNEGVRAIEKEYRKQNLGVIDKNIVIKTWYSFLLSEFIKPYQCMLNLKYKHYKKEYEFSVPENFIKSIAFYQDEQQPRWYNSMHIQYYINSARDIRKDNTSHLAHCCINDSNGHAISRIEKIYDHIFFDELQDYAGWDLDIIYSLFVSKINICCVGDYKQATFRTNNSIKNKAYRDDKIKNYFIELEKKNICNINYSNSTRRFNQKICNFVNTLYDDKENSISPYIKELHGDIDNIGVYIIDNKYMAKYCEYYLPTILKYRCDSKVNFEHKCDVFNYGNSKGATFDRVVIIPVSTVESFITTQSKITSKQTLSKFYVACTRARFSTVFAMDITSETEKFKAVELKLGCEKIPAYKYEG